MRSTALDKLNRTGTREGGMSIGGRGKRTNEDKNGKNKEKQFSKKISLLDTDSQKQ